MGKSRRLNAYWLLIGGMMSVFAACSASGDKASADGAPVATYEVQEGSQGGDEALLTGTLDLRDGCLWVVNEASSQPAVTLPAFAADDVSWNQATELLVVGGVEARLGSTVELTGGLGDPDEARLPSECETAGEVFYVSPQGFKLLS